jgi:hypothetical protein
MTEDGGFVCHAPSTEGDRKRHEATRGGAMRDEDERGATVVELLLREPEIVAWLDDRRPEPDADDRDRDDEPPRAA